MIIATLNFKISDNIPPPPAPDAALEQIAALLAGALNPPAGTARPLIAVSLLAAGNISPSHRSSKSSRTIAAPKTSSRSRSIARPRLSRAATVPGRVAKSSATGSIV